MNGLSRAVASLRVPHYAKVYACGWIFSVSRWALAFLGAYVVNEATGSPRLVQLTGTVMWGPLLFAGLVGGAVADRLDRRAVVLGLFAVMAPLTALLGVLELLGELAIGVVYLAMLLVGFAWIVDMTARRALIYDLVGPAQINNAMALEMVSTASGLALGSLVSGSVIEYLGVGPAFLVIAGLVAAAALLLLTVPSQPRAQPRAGESFLASLREGFRALPANPILVSILGVTVIVNLFHFPYFPIVQVIGERVGASALGIGALASAGGFGMMASALWVASASPHRGRAYVLGPAIAMLLMLGFALFREYSLVFASLFAASLCLGLFGATQGALIMTSVPDEVRGRALGLLSTAIGSLPIGMYALGELAEVVGAPAAVVAFNVSGFVALGVWTLWRPEARRQP